MYFLVGKITPSVAVPSAIRISSPQMYTCHVAKGIINHFDERKYPYSHDNIFSPLYQIAYLQMNVIPHQKLHLHLPLGYRPEHAFVMQRHSRHLLKCLQLMEQLQNGESSGLFCSQSATTQQSPLNHVVSKGLA
eukprot:TRINITY_DN8540_c0_g3_i1.p1 TRINITY_DN8540_c0_g3~~TRINITY_DN8540_c0_g3_i1.p1  ORF type:complete len:150 (+),score=11.01 TRINITY_DN8540_c0_g3_i1:49-450(+)